MVLVQDRGLAVRIDMLQSAVFDCDNLRLTQQQINSIERSLREVPFSNRDTAVGEVRTRDIGQWDVGFLTTRSDDCLVITIMKVQPASKVNPLAKKLRLVGLVASIRGALGF